MKHLTGGKIATCSDSKKVINGVLNEIDKEKSARKKQAQLQKR